MSDTERSTEDVLFGDKQVRWFQLAAQKSVEQYLEDGYKRLLVCHPTGAGKTITSGLIFTSDRVRKALGVTDRPLRLLFIAHMHRLLTQAEKTYAETANVQIIPHSAFQQIPDDLEWDIACIDEAHHEAMQSIQYQLEQLGERPIIGLTATPDRPDNCLIKFEQIINPISRSQAVDEGWLAPTYIHSIVDSAHKDKSAVTERVIDQYGDQFGQTLMFFRTRKEMHNVTKALIARGYSAVALDNQSERERDQILRRFEAGEIQIIVNCNRLNEGVDLSGCTDVYLGRQFGSYPQLNQVIGRAARPDGDCVVWELINPLSNRNLDTTAVVGVPQDHQLHAEVGGKWVDHQFDYVTEYVDTGGL